MVAISERHDAKGNKKGKRITIALLRRIDELKFRE